MGEIIIVPSQYYQYHTLIINISIKRIKEHLLSITGFLFISPNKGFTEV